MLRHRCRLSTVPATTHVPPLHFSKVRIQLPLLATIKGHRVITDAFGSEERLGQIKHRAKVERFCKRNMAQCDKIYQGERIKEAAKGGWKGGNTGSDGVDMDLERGI